MFYPTEYLSLLRSSRNAIHDHSTNSRFICIHISSVLSFPVVTAQVVSQTPNYLVCLIVD